MGRVVSRKKEDEEDSGIEISSTESRDCEDMKAPKKNGKQFKTHNSKKKNSKFSIIDSFALFFKSGLKL